MDLRYEEYLSPRNKFYRKNTTAKKKSRFHLEYPEGWVDQLDDEQHWRYAIPPQMPLAPQGWKIHISATLDQSQETLERVAKVLFAMNVHFKFVMSKWDLFLKNSKYADRASSGKFITIYPSTEYVFLTLVRKLAKVLEGMEKGPYILNDDRWLDSNVYFRYGAFLEMKNANGEPSILDENNQLIPDQRVPEFVLPSFVELPADVQTMEKEKEAAAPSAKRLDDYQITEVLHFSNAGGVYKATEKQSQTEVIIKEGRPGAGLDGNGTDGFQRINTEYEDLKALANVSTVVNVRDHFTAWEHNYLVEDLVHGVPLESWIAQNYPFTFNEQASKQYVADALKILQNLIQAIQSIHQAGIGISDLSATNVLLDRETFAVHLIDLEVAGPVDKQFNPGLQTPGFANPHVTTRRQADNFALYRIIIMLFCPASTSVGLDNNGDRKLIDWIEEHYGTAVSNLNVGFHLVNGKDLQIDATMQGNFKVLVFGESGGGKTTLLKLIKGDLSPNTGKIELTDKNGAQLNRYQSTALISQTPYIFNTTLFNNVTLFQPERYEKSAVIDAIKSVGLFDELGGENALNYNCGLMGRRLSGGQLQRVEIARALLSKKKLFLVDEATANLDAKNAAKIRQLLFNLPTPMVEVAHHFDQSDIRYTNEYDLENGKLVKVK